VTATTIVYRREQLYEEVWREPASIVARRYSISGVALGKICRKLTIPVPGRGYWQQHAVGKSPPKPPLPPVPEAAQRELRVTRYTSDHDPVAVAQSHDLGDAAMGPPIVVPRELERPHPLVAAAIAGLENAKLRNGRARTSQRCLDINVSPALLPRAFRLMNALIVALEERGLNVEVTNVAPRHGARSDDDGVTRVLVGDEWIRFELVEALKQFVPPMTKEPPRRLAGDELATWRRWNRPRMELVTSGVLVLRIAERVGVRKSWRDNRRPLEQKLNAFIKYLFVAASAKKQASEERERWRREFEAQQDRSLRKQEREERDERRVARVRLELERWREARDLRTLATEARERLSKHPGHPEPKWLRWAERHADRIDPTRFEIS